MKLTEQQAKDFYFCHATKFSSVSLELFRLMRDMAIASISATSHTATSREAVIEECLNALNAIDDLAGIRAIRSALKYPAPQGTGTSKEWGPCSCQDGCKCEYIDGSPACMQEEK